MYVYPDNSRSTPFFKTLIFTNTPDVHIYTIKTNPLKKMKCNSQLQFFPISLPQKQLKCVIRMCP